MVCALPPHVLEVNEIPSRKCQAHRSSWRSSQEKASVLEQGSTTCAVCSRERLTGDHLTCWGNTTMSTCPPPTLTAAPTSHTAEGSLQPTGGAVRQVWACSDRYVLFSVCKNLLISDFPFLILSSVTYNKLMLDNVLCNTEEFNFWMELK